MSCHRVQDLRNKQPGHRDEQGPKTFLTCSFFPNASIAASASAFMACKISFGRISKTFDLLLVQA
jgi:hypothetical protein